jgi:hypothetical protein
VDEFLQIDMNWVVLDFYFSKTNPQIESLEIWIQNNLGFANLDFQGFVSWYSTKDL